LQRKFGQITESEYKNSLAVMQQSRTTFNQNQINALTEYYKKTQDTLRGLIQQTAQEQIADLK
jgi:hypothetical protein